MKSKSKPCIRLYNHAGSKNHGCEAIVRSTISLFPGYKIALYSNNPEEDKIYGIDKIVELHKSGSDNIPWYAILPSKIQTKLTGKFGIAMYYRYKNLYRDLNDGDILLSIGGDNYCYKGTDLLVELNRILRKKNVKTVLWGCSVDPNVLGDLTVKKDLESFDLIVAREKITYTSMMKINKNTIIAPDPAFCLKTVKDYKSPTINKDVVGINLSPLVFEYREDCQTILEAYIELCDFIINETGYSIALIPHVIKDGNDDRTILNELYKKYEYTKRCFLIPDQNCMQLKSIISRCRFFIGARTHATIAAYSSGIPTGVCGYSIKSIGIAEELFGNSKDYVISIENIEENSLVKMFNYLSENEMKIKELLSKKIPEMQDECLSLYKVIQDI